MQGTWFAVRRPNGTTAYIAGREVQVLPRRVEAAQRSVLLRAGPGAEYESTTRVNLQGTYEVLDMRHRFGQGLWYRLQIEDIEGWVPDLLVQQRFVLPVEDFIACLSYYRTRRVEAAYWACSQFIQTPGVKEKNVNLAMAYQVQGASSLIFKDPFSFEATMDLEAFSKAIDFTPYDPAAYNLRALAQFGAARRLDDVFADLKQALDLDPENLGARAFVRALVEVAGSGAFDLPNLDWIEPFLSVERIRQKRHMPLPREASVVGPSAAGDDVLMTIENYTGYTLHLYFVGSVARTVEVRAGKSEGIDLDSGTYAIAAEYTQDPQDKSSNIRPVYGIQNYEPNTQYALKLYLQWFSGS
jgi:tetratricopeptide (TPR) repeat protein